MKDWPSVVLHRMFSRRCGVILAALLVLVAIALVACKGKQQAPPMAGQGPTAAGGTPQAGGAPGMPPAAGMGAPGVGGAPGMPGGMGAPGMGGVPGMPGAAPGMPGAPGAPGMPGVAAAPTGPPVEELKPEERPRFSRTTSILASPPPYAHRIDVDRQVQRLVMPEMRPTVHGTHTWPMERTGRTTTTDQAGQRSIWRSVHMPPSGARAAGAPGGAAIGPMPGLGGMGAPSGAGMAGRAGPMPGMGMMPSVLPGGGL